MKRKLLTYTTNFIKISNMTEYFIKKILAEQLFGTRLCESIEQQNKVNYMYRKLLLEMLVGEPITIDELRDLLQRKIVNFEFIKLNGEVRPARGTTNLKYVPGDSHPKGTGNPHPTVATFYDLKKQLWRSVSQKSKEIVLKQDIEGKRPIVTVTDKNKDLVNKLDRFEVGKTYEYINRYGESGHTVTVMEVVEKGYYLKLDKNGPLFYLTIDTANKRIKSEITKVKNIVQPITSPTNKVVSKVKKLINEPSSLSKPIPPLDIKDDRKKAYDVKDEEIIAPSNIIEPTIIYPSDKLSTPTIEPSVDDAEIEEPAVEEEPMHELPYEDELKNKLKK